MAPRRNDTPTWDGAETRLGRPHILVRIWRAKIHPERISALENFAHAYSLPMFQAQVGCLGVLFTRNGSRCVTISIWENAAAIERLQSSRTYQEIVRQLEATGILEGEQSVESFQAFGGFLNWDEISVALDAGNDLIP